MNKRFERSIQSAVLAGSIAIAGGVVVSCDEGDASKSKSSSSSSSSSAILAVDDGTDFVGKGSPYTLTGTKPAKTSVWINGVEAVERDSDETWSAEVDLVTGTNTFTLIARDSKSREKGVLGISIAHVASPMVDDGTDITVAAADLPLVLTGTKAAGANLMVNGDEVVEKSDDTTWEMTITHSHLEMGGDTALSLTSTKNDVDSGATDVNVEVDISGPPALLDA